MSMNEELSELEQSALDLLEQLVIREQEVVVLSEAEQELYLALYEYLKACNVEIPFGVEI